jgi:uncharacterized membrane protein YhaH (DUF805 family)
VNGTIRRFLTGRGRRLEYWLAVIAISAASLTIVNLVRNAFTGEVLDWSSLAVWCVFAARRTRDAGRPIWLAFSPFVLMLGAKGVKWLLFLTDAALFVAPGVRTAADTAMGLFVLGLAIVLGVWKSKPVTQISPERQAEVFG